MDRIVAAVVIVLLVLMLTGCVTPIDWNSRIGVYTYNQAVTDYGTPAVTDRLNDGSIVANWMTRREHAVVTPGPIGSPGVYTPTGFYYGAGTTYSTTYFPAQFLRLEFDANQRLKAWKKYSK